MSLFKKIFGKRKNSVNSNTKRLEEKLGFQFPAEFRKLISNAESQETILKLLDEDYIVLDAFNNSTVENKFEDILLMIEELNIDSKESNVRKIPFARNLKAGKDKYLSFEQVNGELNGKILFSDCNKIINRLDITSVVSCNKLMEVDFSNDLRPNSLQNLINASELPASLKNWKDSFEFISSELKETENRVFDLEVHANCYSFSKKEEDFSKFEVQGMLPISNRIYSFSSAYEIDNQNLARSINYNLDYRLFYYKLICIIDTLKLVKEKISNDTMFYDYTELEEVLRLVRKPLKSISNEKHK